MNAKPIPHEQLTAITMMLSVYYEGLTPQGLLDALEAHQHRGNSTPDMDEFLRIPEAAKLLKITRRHVYFRVGYFSEDSVRGVVTDDDSEMMIRRFEEPMDAVKAMCLTHVKNVTIAPVMWACTRYMDEDEEKASEFISALVTGAGLTTSHPVLTLRNWLMANGRGTSGANSPEWYWRTVSAINAHREGRTLSKLYEASSDWDGKRRV